MRSNSRLCSWQLAFRIRPTSIHGRGAQWTIRFPFEHYNSPTPAVPQILRPRDVLPSTESLSSGHDDEIATVQLHKSPGPRYRSEFVISGQRITHASGKLIGVAPRGVIEDMPADNELVGLGHFEERAQATRDGLGGAHE